VKEVESRAVLPGKVVCDYVLKMVDQPQELVILLHGYQQSGRYLFDKLASQCPSNAVILAPNGPYPLPERKADGTYRLGFSWYFYNPATDSYYIDMSIALEMLARLVEELGYSELPKRIVGFSQGGYLAPFAAMRFKAVKQVVGIASEFVADEWRESAKTQSREWPPQYRVDSIHGDQDDIVEVKDSRKNHEILAREGARGEFRMLPGIGHRITSEVKAAVGEVLAK
jgi:predicted esterase